MATQPTRTLSARVDPQTHSSVLAALQPRETASDFLLAAVRGELAKRRAQGGKEPTLADIAQLAQASVSKTTLSQSMLTLIDSKLNRLISELDIQS